MTDRVDVREMRTELKLVKDTGDAQLFESRGAACPGCGRPFDRLFLTERRHHRFDPDGEVAFCLINEPDRAVLVLH